MQDFCTNKEECIMPLFVSNACPETVWASLLVYDPRCQGRGQPWRKIAWYSFNPGRTGIPDALGVDLTTVNGWAGIYAYAASGKNWQGSGNAWFQVTNRMHFNQCSEDETNCMQWVDFWGVYFNGQSSTIVYIGPDSGQIRSTQPCISVTPGSGMFFISGRGFAPGSSAMVIYNYFYGSNIISNSSYPNVVSIDSSGNFSDFIYVSNLLYSGHLKVQATDNIFNDLNAATSVSF